MHWTEFVMHLRAWALANQQPIRARWAQPGGWQQWAEPEILGYLLAQRPGASIVRELHCWGGIRPATFVLNLASPDPGEIVVVQLRVQSPERHRDFFTGLSTDLGRLAAGLAPKYARATLLVAGFYRTGHGTRVPDQVRAEPVGTGGLEICWATDRPQPRPQPRSLAAAAAAV